MVGREGWPLVRQVALIHVPTHRRRLVREEVVKKGIFLTQTVFISAHTSLTAMLREKQSLKTYCSESGSKHV